MPNFKKLIAYLKDMTGRGKNISKAIVFFAFVSLLSFENAFAQDQSVIPDPAVKSDLPLDRYLHVLYLTNKDKSDQLNQILAAWKNRRGHSKKPKKIVFQFIYKSDNTVSKPDNTVSLIAFTGRKSWGRTHYQNGTAGVILTVSPYIPQKGADMKGKDVIFGDQEINIAKDDKGEKPVNVLFNIADNPNSGNAYVYFTPQLLCSNGGTYIIQYSLSIGDGSHPFDKTLVSTSINVSTNPSPPRNSF